MNTAGGKESLSFKLYGYQRIGIYEGGYETDYCQQQQGENPGI